MMFHGSGVRRYDASDSAKLWRALAPVNITCLPLIYRFYTRAENGFHRGKCVAALISVTQLARQGLRNNIISSSRVQSASVLP